MQMSCAYPCSFGGRAVDYLEMKNEFTTEQNDRKTGAEEVGKKKKIVECWNDNGKEIVEVKNEITTEQRNREGRGRRFRGKERS